MLVDIPFSTFYIDNVIVIRERIKEHKTRLKTRSFSDIQEYELRVYRKVWFFGSVKKYMESSSAKLEKRRIRIELSSDMPDPNNISELCSLLEMVNSYQEFVQNLFQLLDHILRDLNQNCKLALIK